jgi:hypothetical protein
MLKNKFFVAIVLCCFGGISMAMDLANAERVIPHEVALAFSTECAAKLGTNIMISFKEWEETEQQTERIGNTLCFCPQLFLCNYWSYPIPLIQEFPILPVSSEEFVVKAVRDRGISEISGAKRIYSSIPSIKRTSDTADVVSCIFYAIFRNGQLLEVKHVKDYQSGEICQNDWVLEFTRRAPGISLEKLFDPTSEFFGKGGGDMFKKIGEAIHYLNFELNVINGDLHYNNIIVDINTMKVSFIDFDCWKERKAEDESDVALLFFSIFFERFLYPIMRGEFQTTESTEKILDSMYLLLSYSLGKSGRTNPEGTCAYLFFWRMYNIVRRYGLQDVNGADISAQANIPDGILDHKIEMLCKCLKRFIVFFISKRSMFPVRVDNPGIREESYAEKAIKLFFSIWTDPGLNNPEAIRAAEENIGIPGIRWHASMLPE